MTERRYSEESGVILNALRGLRPAGEKSFERLAADLLTELTGTPFRLSRSGDQHGVDARSAEGVGLEMKRYEDSTELDERKLLGELEQASHAKRDLQVWGLVTTGDVPVQLHEKLKDAAREKGLGFFVLDKAAAYPLPVPAIVALVAAFPDHLLRVLCDAEWKDPKKDVLPTVEASDRALTEIRQVPGLGEWMATLKDQIRGLPTWDRVRREQNRRLKKRLQNDAEALFGTDFNPAAAVRREAQNRVRDWFEGIQALDEPPVAVVLGERYDGKTWMVYQWLLSMLDESRLPVFLFGAKHGDGHDRVLKEMIVLEIADLLGIEVDQARRLFSRFSAISAGAGPWGLIVLDGLNEYRVDPERPLQHFAHAAAERTDLNHRACAVLATARSHWWQEQGPRVRQSTTQIEVGPYSDVELQEALAKSGEDLSVLAAVQESAQGLIRRPRYLQLVLDQRERLGKFGVVTGDVLHYLDASDKMRSRGYLASGTGWNHLAYSGALSDFAKRFLDEAQVGCLWERREINSILSGLVGDPHAALRDLESEGVVISSEGGYEVSPARLTTGMGLFLGKVLRSASKEGRSLIEELNDLLEPMKETDEKVSWLKASVVFELLRADAGVADAEPAVLDTLVREWLGSRNLGTLDVQDAEALCRQLLPSLLRLAFHTWSENGGDPRVQEASLLVFTDTACHPEDSPGYLKLEEAARAWCRRVPKAGTRFLNTDNREGMIKERLMDGCVARLGLELASDRGALKLQRVALYLDSLRPGLLDADSLLAVVAIEKVAPNPLDEAERRLIRDRFAEIPREWFESHVLTQEGKTEFWRAVCFRLLALTDRVDLDDLRESVAPVHDPEREMRLREWHPTIEDHLRLAQTTPTDGENILRFAERSSNLVLDPDHPRPLERRLEILAADVRGELEDVRLQAGRMATAEDHRFRYLVPALAAWLPGIGSEVIVDQIRDLPRRFGIDDEDEETTYFAWRLSRHSVLLTGSLRGMLRRVLERSYPDDRRQFDAAFVFLSLMPGMSAAQRLSAIRGHRLEYKGECFEWTTIYRLAAFLENGAFREMLRSKLDKEEDALKLGRLRLLAAEIGGIPLSDKQAMLINRDLAAVEGRVRFAAVAAGAEGKPTSLSAGRLMRIVQEEDHRASLAPRYAAWCLVQKGECLDELPVYWQAVAAVQHAERRVRFLMEVERALYASVRGAVKADDPLTSILVRSHLSDPVRQRVWVSDDVSDADLYFFGEDPGIGGLDDLDPHNEEGGGNPFDALPQLTEKKNRLAKEAAERFKSQARDHEGAWQGEVFPQQLVDSLKPERFAAWAELLLSASSNTEMLWTGLLQSMFRRALREGSDLARALFVRCFPFSRFNALRGVSFVDKELHWTLHHLSDPTMDDSKARDLLAELVLDSRSDLELYQIALSARLKEPARLEAIVGECLEDSEVETRGRGVMLAGWLTAFENQLEALHQGDPSRYIRRLAADAIASVRREQWARHWFRIFLSNKTQERRWGAGQLFLACADRRVESWTDGELGALTATRPRGEAFLLLEAARSESKDRQKKLKDTFLGVKVRDLESLCHPWRPRASWRRLENRRGR